MAIVFGNSVITDKCSVGLVLKYLNQVFALVGVAFGENFLQVTSPTALQWSQETTRPFLDRLTYKKKCMYIREKKRCGNDILR